MATQSTLYSPFNGRLARSIGYEVDYGKQFSEKGLMIVFDVRRTHLNLVRPVLPSGNFFIFFRIFFVFFRILFRRHLSIYGPAGDRAKGYIANKSP